jgi:hypothetical protein
MALSPMRRVARIGARAPRWIAAITLLLAGAALAFVALSAPVARADTPTVTATVDKAGSTSTQTHVVVAGKGFPPNTTYTYSIGGVPPFQGTTDASGNAYGASNIDVVAGDGSPIKDCLTATIEAGGSTASASITVGPISDSDTGQPCGTPSAGTTPTVDATAAAAASATAAAAPTATNAPAAPTTDNSSPPSPGLRARLAQLPLGLIGGGVAVLFIVIVIVVAMGRRGNDDMGGYSSPGGRGGTGYRQGPPRQGPPRQGPPRGPDRSGSTYGRRY